jgi:hypothetical protein
LWGARRRLESPRITHRLNRTLAGLVDGQRILDIHLKPAGAKQPHTLLNRDYQGRAVNLPAQVKFTGPLSEDGKCEDVVRGLLALYGVDRDQARKLLALISSRETFAKVLKTIVREHFADPSWEPDGFHRKSPAPQHGELRARPSLHDSQLLRRLLDLRSHHQAPPITAHQRQWELIRVASRLR